MKKTLYDYRHDPKTREKYAASRVRYNKKYYAEQKGTKPKCRWTTAEVQLICDETFTDRELVEMLGRSMRSIQVKRSKLRAMPPAKLEDQYGIREVPFKANLRKVTV